MVGTAGIVLAALEYDKLPIFTAHKHEYSAYFAESSGLDSGARVQVSGFQVGAVTTVELDGARVLVKFDVSKDIRLGDRTEAAIKAKSLLGVKVLEITPRGDGELRGPIPWTAPLRPISCPTPWAIWPKPSTGSTPIR